MGAATEILKPKRAAATGDIVVIDYLRGIAALGVAVFHARVTLWAGWREIQAHPATYSLFERAVAWLSAPAPFLGSFVILFFVVSGFCVHLPQAGSEEPLALRAYLARRFFRIYPPYLAAVALSAALAAPGGEPVWSSVFMAQNYVAGRQLSTNPALWSLPVELELYLAYPLVWWLVRRSGWRIALTMAAAVSIAVAVAVTKGIDVLAGNFALYWIIWCSGAWLADALARKQLRAPPVWLTVAAIGGGTAAGYATARQIGGGTINLAWGFFYFWLVWQLLAKRERFAVLPVALDFGLRGLGRISYSLYLLHFPALTLLGAWWVTAAGEKPHNYLISLAACAAMLPAAWLFFRAVELPSHQLAKRLARVEPEAVGAPWLPPACTTDPSGGEARTSKSPLVGIADPPDVIDSRHP